MGGPHARGVCRVIKLKASCPHISHVSVDGSTPICWLWPALLTLQLRYGGQRGGATPWTLPSILNGLQKVPCRRSMKTKCEKRSGEASTRWMLALRHSRVPCAPCLKLIAVRVSKLHRFSAPASRESRPLHNHLAFAAPRAQRPFFYYCHL